ncbi:MAG TPA: RtcB family protein [Coriobacteriia bacterium]|nr:RtcB family protein [Coriobacteriia bacterium]
MDELATAGLPIKVWGSGIDDDALAQARNLARLPFAFRHVAVMPDAHVGYGMPIGGVLATFGQVIPHAVGLDIGCGVRGWNTNLPLAEFSRVRDIVLNDIQRSVPTGFEWHRTAQDDRTTLFDDVPDVAVLRAEVHKAVRQVGTLGGGNHFIEAQVDPNGTVWMMVHSGSRNLGKQMAEHYDRLAREENRASHSPVPAEWGLAHLAAGSGLGAEYLEVMGFCLRFARENRRLMADAARAAIERRLPGVSPGDDIDVHHNYAAVEEHFGERVVVHRKGAVRARGMVLVPGSMGTASYVCRGLANPESFESCSHGAGRAMGRKAAMRAFPRERVIRELQEAGIRVFKANKRDLSEEAPAAYKDIEDVMRHQSDLVEPLVRLRPIGVIKG